MAYLCPRCGSPVSRAYNSGAQFTAGLIGALFVAAFGSFGCQKCGKIPRAEFADADRRKMLTGSVIMALVALAVAVGVLALLSNN